VTGFHLRRDVEERGPRDVRPWSGLAPGERVALLGDGELEELVPRRVELHFVDPVPEAVVRAEDRRIGVRLSAPDDRLAAGQGPEAVRSRLRPATSLAPERLDEGPVLPEEVVVRQRRRLVQHLVRRATEAFGGLHATSPFHRHPRRSRRHAGARDHAQTL
jgi:hypothetical protein